ncbi:hypothetical protein C8R45DRAFT_1183667 [Mycena sanguinolenta]|nr:hypothetical protein C8R45DRAFT_1183667 [Mycena sanguinolenta]
MFALKVAAVFAAMLATVVRATPAAQPTSPVPSLKGGLHVDGANAISIMESCNDLNLGGICFFWSSSTLPSGCGDFRSTSPSQDDQLTSVSSGPGIRCTLFADPGCTGRSQVVVGTINDLRTVGFDDTATSFFCAST